LIVSTLTRSALIRACILIAVQQTLA